MYFWALFFWVAVVSAVVLSGWNAIGLLVYEGYHPMLARGDLFFPLRIASVPMLILTAAVVVFLWFRQRPLTRTIYMFGLLAVSIFVAMPALPRINSGYKQTYFLDKEKFEIPWNYSPRAGTSKPGGESFYVTVSFPGLVPRYDTRDETINIGISTKSRLEISDGESDEACNENYLQGRTTCHWTFESYFYVASGKTEILPMNRQNLFSSITELFESFRTKNFAEESL